MIGQKNNLAKIDKMVNEFPHFLVIVGSKGSGKSMLAKYVAQKLSATYSVCGIKVDEVREVINTAYKSNTNVVYHIKDADNMRAEAKNAMLKITEEPPKDAYFILTVQSDNSLLDTIKSRAYMMYIEPYSKEELEEYGGYTNYLDIATTPYEMDMLDNYGKEFLNYVELVVDNLGEVASANAFKSGNKLSFKNEDEDGKYDLKLFYLAFIQTCTHRLSSCDNIRLYSKYILITDKYLRKIQSLSVNKQQMYDMWVFEIRQCWEVS